MFKPVSLLSFIVAVAGFFASIVGIATVWDDFTPLINSLIDQVVEIRLVWLVGGAILLLLLPFLWLNSKLYFSRAKLINSELEVSSLKGILANSERLRMTDIVTGIPNQAQFDFDLQEVGGSVTYDKPHQLIFIDLIGFGKINSKFGYAKGDAVIEYFARSLHDTMRRNEFIYKLPFKEDPDRSELWRRAYRKHTGGDEFLIVIGGEEAEAVGFLNRLENRVVKTINRHVQNEILASTDWSLSFTASIVPIYPNDQRAELMERAHEGMRIARQSGSNKRLFWSSKVKPEDLGVFRFFLVE